MNSKGYKRLDLTMSGGNRGTSSAGGGLKDFCRHHPPGVVFLVCLLSFAVSTCVLSMYIRQGTSFRNPGSTVMEQMSLPWYYGMNREF